jgi:hypothetical protein
MENHNKNLEKDMSYSPASDAETEQLQETTVPAARDADVDYDQVEVLPGTGGPDDVGDVEFDESDESQFRKEIGGDGTRSLP